MNYNLSDTEYHENYPFMRFFKITVLNVVGYLNIELSSYSHKDTQHPEYLRQLALETIHKDPCGAGLRGSIQIHTDGSMGISADSGSGSFLKKGNDIRICKRNPDYTAQFFSGRTLNYSGGFEILLY
ncbi:hypothetical protein TNCV_1553391 [Trichonephila clavipes]|nr:hypothetical protein TNCV_1553391 [Trichonephila clavipes]